MSGDPSRSTDSASDHQSHVKNEELEEKRAENSDNNKQQTNKSKLTTNKKSDLTSEDIALRDKLDSYVYSILDVDNDGNKLNTPAYKHNSIIKNALNSIDTEIRSATGSMTALPKPLKFLRPHYKQLKQYYDIHYINKHNDKLSQHLSDILSVIAMTAQPDYNNHETLFYRLHGQQLPIDHWGHEYVRHISGEIAAEYSKKLDNNETQGIDELDKLINEIVPFFMKHASEIDAIDLLVETNKIDDVIQHTDDTTYDRINKYILRCSDYIADTEDQQQLYNVVYSIYTKHKAYTDALRVAIKLNNKELIVNTFNETSDDILTQQQLAFICGQYKIVIDELRDNEEVFNLMGNSKLSEYYQQLAIDLDVKDVKTPDDIYKSWLEDNGSGLGKRATVVRGNQVDSAKQNLASTFVNAFVNVGFGRDALITPEGSDWLYKNKSHGMLSAAASLGMILLWDVETGFSTVDKYSFSTQNFIKAGAALADGILSSGITGDMDAAQALLSEHIDSSDNDLCISAILGLGIAYAGTAREDILEMLVPKMIDANSSIEIVAMTCLSLGLVYVGTGNDDISGSMIEAFLDCNNTELNDSVARLMCVGIGLLFIGQADNIEPTLQALDVIEHPIQKYLKLTVETCAYAGTGNVLCIQKLLTVAAEHLTQDDDSSTTEQPGTNAATQAGQQQQQQQQNTQTQQPSTQTKDNSVYRTAFQDIAVLGISIVAIGEELSTEMVLRSLDHILQYGELNVRRIVPLALGLLSISNPRLTILDTLSKLSHDNDMIVSQNAVLSMGFLGAGTNNARIATVLRGLATYYSKEPNHLFLVRIAQGLLHLGKGLITLNPVQSDGFIVDRINLAGLLAVFHTCLDLQNNILNKRHYLLYILATVIRPRWLMTVDEQLKPLPVSVRVGQRVDTIGVAGKPKTITGFQTHNTPVLLATGERAQLSTDEYIPLTSILEGIVILKKNQNYVAA